MEKINLFDIAVWCLIILGFLLIIGGFGSVMYLIWFLAPWHWVIKLFLTLTFDALIIIAKEMADFRTTIQLDELEKYIDKE